MRPAAIVEDNWIQKVPLKEFYNVQDLVVILDVGSPSIYETIRSGNIPAFRVDGVLCVRHDDLLAYIRRRGMSVQPDREIVVEKFVPPSRPQTRTDGEPDLPTRVEMPLLDDDGVELLKIVEPE
jgi:hypothetical protein